MYTGQEAKWIMRYRYSVVHSSIVLKYATKQHCIALDHNMCYFLVKEKKETNRKTKSKEERRKKSLNVVKSIIWSIH